MISRVPSVRMKHIRLITLLLMVGLTGVLESRVLAQEALTGEALCQKACASCHRPDLRGGQAQSLVGAIWRFGSGRGDIRRNIKHAISDFPMPAFETTLSDRQIDQILDFLT